MVKSLVFSVDAVFAGIVLYYYISGENRPGDEMPILIIMTTLVSNMFAIWM